MTEGGQQRGGKQEDKLGYQKGIEGDQINFSGKRAKSAVCSTLNNNSFLKELFSSFEVCIMNN